jgi:hypothetical protein
MAKLTPQSDRPYLRPAPVIGGAAFAIMASVAFGLAVLMLAAGKGALPPMFYASPNRAAESDENTMIKRAVFAEGRLWLLSGGGAVWTIRPSGRDAERVAVPGLVQDLCVRNGHVVSAASGASAGEWVLRESSATGWRDLSTIASRGDGLTALLCEADGVLLVTTKRIVEARGDGGRSANLSEALPIHAVSSIAATPDAIYVGLNAGEWGGGLRRIDRRDGTVVLVEAKRSQDLCEGPLNGDCDPVTAVIPDPAQPGCVTATVGLVHMQAHGSVLEICGDEVRPLYVKPCGMPLIGPHDARTRRLYAHCSEAFFGLARAGDVLWAAGNDGLYKRDGKGEWSSRPLPQFKPYGPFSVSFAFPSLVLVLTDANQRYSLSGATPLMVGR